MMGILVNEVFPKLMVVSYLSDNELRTLAVIVDGTPIRGVNVLKGQILNATTSPMEVDEVCPACYLGEVFKPCVEDSQKWGNHATFIE